MLLELPISEVLLEGKEEESAEGEREAEWWEKIVKSSPQILSKLEKRSIKLGGGGGGGGVGGGRKVRKEIGTTQGKGHGITQGRQGMC